MKKDPLRWMPWDVVSWFTSRRVSGLSPLARGVYFELLCRQWYEGSLPPSDEELAVCGRVTFDQWREVKTSVLQFFEKDEHGMLRQERCDDEKQHALARLKRFQKQTRPATKARLRKIKERKELPRDVDVTSHVTKEPDRTLPDRTGQDITLPDPPPLPPPRPTDDVRGGNGEEKFTPPRGTTTVFDQQAEIAKLLDRYRAGDDPLTPDPEDAENALKAIDQITAGSRPGAKLIFLRTLAQFEPLQVCMAANDWLNLPDLPAGDPKGYFVGMIRGSGKRKYVRYADRVETKQERTQQDARKRADQGTDGKPVDQPAPDARHTPGFHSAGDILRDLPPLQRARQAGGRTPPTETDDFPECV